MKKLFLSCISRIVSSHIILILLILFFVSGNIVWIILDGSPPLWDIAGHSARSILVAQLLHDWNFHSILRLDTIYPPFSYIVSGILFLLFGSNADIPQYSLLLWTMVLYISTYSIAVQLYQKKSIGVGACLLLLGYPLLLHFSRIFDLDLPQTAIVTATFAALLRSKNFTDYPWTLGTACLIALALLTKWTSIIFLFGPFFMILVSTLRAKEHRSVSLKNISHGFLLLLCIAGPWYALHSFEVLKSLIATRNNGFSVPFENLISFKNSFYYIGKTITGMSWPLALFACAGFLRLLYKRTRQDWFLIVWCVVPYLVMTFLLYSKENRYFLPIFPALAIASAVCIAYLPKIFRIPGWFAIIILVCFFWVDISWHTRLLPHTWYLKSGLALTYGYYEPTPQGPGYGFSYPTKYQMNIQDIIKTLADDILKQKRKGTIQIAVVPNSIFLTAQQIQYYGKLNGIDNPRKPFRLEYALSSRIRGPEWRKDILKADYLITKTGDQGPLIWGPSLPDIYSEESNKKSDIFSQFELIRTYPLYGIENKPQEARLYRHK